jgi:hypothetical protein
MELSAQVEDFLDNFKVKMNIWGLLISSNRQKNVQTMADLEIRHVDLIAELADLSVINFSEGPLTDVVNGGPEMWVFGKQIKGHEIYIKLTSGQPGKSPVCISFHFAEHPLLYPFRQ